MFVDAPEFPETKDSSLVNSRASLVSTNSSNNKTFGPQEANSSIDVSSNTRKTSKAAAKTSKNKLDEAKVANVSRKNSKTLQNSNHSQPETPVVSENLLRTSGESKMRKPQLGRTKSPEELNNKKRGKLTSRSDSPLNLTNRSFSSSSPEPMMLEGVPMQLVLIMKKRTKNPGMCSWNQALTGTMRRGMMVCDEGNFRIYLQISTFFFFFLLFRLQVPNLSS